MAEVQKVVVQIEADTDKATAEVNTFKKAIEDGIGDALKEAGVSAEQFEDGIKSLTKTGTEGFKSLRVQIKEAKAEAQGLADKFGENSKQALNAQKNVARLTEELDDFNQRVKALNPEAKFTAASNAIQGMIGGLQGVTGALQLFGAESEEVEKIAMKMQGALNLAQGINSVMGLKDAFGNLKISLGLATVAQQAMTTAEVEGAVATRGLTAALAANPFTAVAVAITVAAAALLAYTEATDDAAESTERLNKARQDEIEGLANEINSTYKAMIRNLTQIKEIREAEGASVVEIAKLEKQIADIRVQGIQKFIGTFGASAETIQKLSEAKHKQELAAIALRKALEELRVENDKLKNNFKPIDPLPSPQVVQKRTEDTMDVIGTTIDKKSSDIPPLPFWSPEEIRERAAFFLSVAQETLSVYRSFTQAQYTEDIQALEESRRQNAITEERYQERLRRIKRKAAEDDKKAQLFAATMGAAQAIINALGTTPASAVPFAVALASITGAANIAKIAATPIPKFKKGTLNVGGGNLDSDGGMHAIIHKGEAIMPKDRNRAYHPTIAAIYNKRISPHEINRFVEARTKGRKEKVTATINSNDLYRLKPSDSVNIRNSSIIARQIGREIARNQDPRMR